jgi:hypothetical protein
MLSNNFSCKSTGIHKFQNITTFLRILILLYADDVLLISESANALQNALNAFSLYCKQWKLKVNTNKTKEYKCTPCITPTSQAKKKAKIHSLE